MTTVEDKTKLCSLFFSNTPSKPCIFDYKKCALAIMIIVALGSLVIAGIGIAGLGVGHGWWQAASVSHLGRTNALIMTALGICGALVMTGFAIQSCVQQAKAIPHAMN